MEISNTKLQLTEAFTKLKKNAFKVAFVPTMGALHQGHISLINTGKQLADIVVCSIFVNPTQFTDPKDLEKYPRPLEHDIRMLRQAGCDAVFMPSVKEMYPNYPQAENWHIDLGSAEFVLEGELRPGHYQGVTQIVKKLFDVIQPDVALFGQKDFQQVLMIKNMVSRLKMNVQIEVCPIVRETDGLAMSSRNIHLNEKDRKQALILSKALFFIKNHFYELPNNVLIEQATQFFNGVKEVKLDYLAIANGQTLCRVNDKDSAHIVALIAAKIGQTRLIDNIILK